MKIRSLLKNCFNGSPLNKRDYSYCRYKKLDSSIEENKATIEIWKNKYPVQNLSRSTPQEIESQMRTMIRQLPKRAIDPKTYETILIHLREFSKQSDCTQEIVALAIDANTDIPENFRKDLANNIILSTEIR